MKSAFSNIDLDQLRYSMIWESGDNMRRALDINTQDHVLVITSAGCNALNALLDEPQSVTAVDVNEHQNQLLRVKLHIYQYHNHELLTSFLGLSNKISQEQVIQILSATMDKDLLEWTKAFFKTTGDKVMESGRLERYIHGFYESLPVDLKPKVDKLFKFEELSQQADFFIDELDNSAFKELFISYFNKNNLSQGRDPKLFTYTSQSTGEVFYERLLEHSKVELLNHNFYSRFFMYGCENIDPHLWPACYQEQNFDTIARQVHKVTVVKDEAMHYLNSAPGQEVTKASLSNIFEYVSPADFQSAVSQLFSRSRSLKLVYWNLLQDQQITRQSDAEMEARLQYQCIATTACFYFLNKRVLQIHPDPARVHELEKMTAF
ncbi:DUF3419 family protein [Nonlabens ponticola]|uniref:DUF3419 family protein n=1 Tax=Nonlabens ponticola TaxID=2496866 RepID=A0A3S9N0R6_9FLAO|nr:DUF3419 family protein [Nonlabens ponticola]AZQ44922.1 DUF3419 family protein [Nonlabens ponticola]